jgi:CDGSH-type Zn-finger protein/uncharacterized Fe-S cluster protein YjdI
VSARIREYKGKDIVVRYDVKRCIHAEECVKGLPTVFAKDRRPWVDPDGAGADYVAEVVERCPTGALYHERTDGGPGEELPGQNTVTVTVDGPLYVAGEVDTLLGDGSVVSTDTRVAYCRCGASENKPFCDGRHADAGFEAPGAIAESRPDSQEIAAGEKLAVTLAGNGPLLLKGPVTVRGAGGEDTVARNSVALCRCGASQKKPFCDGSHKNIDFVAD